IGATTPESATFDYATVDGSTDAELIIDANATSNDSRLDFYAAGSSEGSIVYNHNSSATSELMEFSVGGSQRVYIKGDGNVGIGESTPDQNLEVSDAAEAEIHVDGGTNAILSLDANADGNSSSLQFQKAGSTEGSIVYNHDGTGTDEKVEFNVGGSTQFYLQGNGRMGIATATPQDLVEIYSSDSGNLSALRITNEGDAANTAAGVSFYGDDSTSNDYEMARVEALQVDNTNTTEDANLSFKTMKAGTLSSAMIIMSTGSVGIGTDTPTDTVDIRGSVVAPLFKGTLNADTVDINGGAIDGTTIGASSASSGTFAFATVDGATDAELIIDANATSNDSKLNFYAGGASEGGITYNHSGTAANELMEFSAGGSTTLYVKGSGRIGVGTNAPASTFDVEGSATIGATYSGSNAAPTNGMIVEGDSGFGTNSPEMRLQVSGGGLCVGSDANCNSDNDTEGTIYATNTTVQAADYAEYFEREEVLYPTDIVGVNPRTGKVRKYQPGDRLLGVVPIQPGIVGNGWADKETNALVGLMGQLEFDRDQVKIKGNYVQTLDGKTLGFLLSNGKVYVNLGSNLDGDSQNQDERIEELEQQHKQQQQTIDELKQQIKYLMKALK
ncbi:hypothetical protein HOF92_15350, partial [bacterium]|nr:hypothetical protein [bacterium]